MLPSGTQLGPYQITAPLGAGGMGEVYRAKDSRLDRDVAIKVLPLQFAQDQARLARFEREAKAVAALSHPNILAIHDFDTEQGQTFAVMELLEGETQRRRLAHGAIPWRKAVEIAVAIADGLSAAHSKGIIHRDLKPDNIFLTTPGWVKILDFGLARIEQPTLPSGDTPTGTYHPAQTELGTILGTVGYMSPEQVRGKEADAKSDVFSLGCLLHEMVTGQRAFSRETSVETLTAILHDEPQDLADSGKKIPLELQRIIQHCLEKNPASRFHSAHDLAFALRAILSDSSGSSARLAGPHADRRPATFWVVAICALVGVAAASAFLIVLSLRNSAATNQAANPGHVFGSLAILPLTNFTREAQWEPLCEGIAEQLSGSLSRVGDLKVRPITSTSHYSGQKVDAKTVGRELNVSAVVTGRLRQEGESLVIALELVDARDNSLVWSNPYKGNKQQILDLQDQMARDLAAKLGLRLTGDEQQLLTKRYTENSSAYMLYTEGKFHFNKFTPEGLQLGIDYFQRALNADPNYAPALAGVARCKVLLGTLHLGPRQTHPEARQLFLKALAIDPNLADAHAGLGAIHLFHDWDWPAAERELKLASANSGWLSWNIYGFWHATQGRLPEALEAIKRGQELDPAAAPRRNELAMCYNWMRRHDDAIVEANKALELDAKFALAYPQLGLAYIRLGKPDQAIAKLQTAIDAGQRHPGVFGMLGYAYAAAGQRPEAQKTIEQLEGLSQGRYGFAMPIARIHAALGNKDLAFEWLNKACEERDSGVIWLKVDPTWENLHSDNQFDELLQKVRLADKLTPTRSASEGSDQPIDTLAVLPFDNQSMDAEAGYLGDDITYSLTDSLMRVRELIVRPYGSAARYKPGTFDAKTAGRELQAQAVLRGSIQKRGDDVIIEVELMHVGEDRRIWGDRYPGKLADRLALQQRIIQEVPERLRLALTGQEKQILAKLPTQNLKAHEFYILGRLEWNKRTPQALEKSIDLFGQAIALDPNFALAWAHLAEAHRASQLNSDLPPRDVIRQAKAAATKALEIDDQLVEAHVALASIAWTYEWRWSEAETGFQRALALNPNHAFAHFRYSQYLTALGRFNAAQVHAQRARDLDPLDRQIQGTTGRQFYFSGQYDAAITQFHKALDIDPDIWVAHLFLGQTYAKQGRYEEAIAKLQEARQIRVANLEPLASLGHVYAVIGKIPESRQVLDELTALSQQRNVPPYHFAIIHAALGDKEQAFRCLNKACEERYALVAYLKVDPMFDSLRDDPRFQKIVTDMKFPK